MSFRNLLLLCLCTPICSAQSAETHNPFTDKNKEPSFLQPEVILVQSEWVEVSSEDLQALTFGEKLLRGGDQIRAELDKLIQLKRATVVESTSLIARPGERSSIYNVEQIIYPTEYEPPLHHPAVTDNKGKLLLSGYIIPASPRAFEERQIGSIVETKPQLLMFHFPVMKMAYEAERVKMHGNLIYATYRNKGITNHIQMPVFTKQSIKTTIILTDKATNLVSISSTFDKAGKLKPNRHLLHFTKATAVAIKP